MSVIFFLFTENVTNTRLLPNISCPSWTPETSRLGSSFFCRVLLFRFHTRPLSQFPCTVVNRVPISFLNHVPVSFFTSFPFFLFYFPLVQVYSSKVTRFDTLDSAFVVYSVNRFQRWFRFVDYSSIYYIRISFFFPLYFSFHLHPPMSILVYPLMI